MNQGWSPDHQQDLAAVDQFAAAALERDPLDVWALSLSGLLRALLFCDFEGALLLFDRAIHASPNSAFVWARSSPTFCYMGSGAEARRRAERALRLSPFDPQARQAICYVVAGNQVCVDCPYGGTDHPVWLNACFVQRLINADLVGSQSAAALQNQNDLAAVGRQRDTARTRLVNYHFARTGL
jgi:tetratricopeptide (TPR) repeat protein